MDSSDVDARGGPGARVAPAPDLVDGRQVEAVMLAQLTARLGAPLVPARVQLPNGFTTDVDGVCADPPVLAAVRAYRGPLSDDQRDGLLADALKLTYVAAQLGGGHRKVICVGGEQAAQPFHGRSWLGGVLRDLCVDVVVVQPDEASGT